MTKGSKKKMTDKCKVKSCDNDAEDECPLCGGSFCFEHYYYTLDKCVYCANKQEVKKNGNFD